jgi:hypothetical protein
VVRFAVALADSGFRDRLGAGQLAERLDQAAGVCYAVNAAGVLVSLGRRNWDAAAAEASVADLLVPERVLGRPLTSFIADEENRAICRECIRIVAAGLRDRIVLPIECCGPRVRRSLFIQISAAIGDDEPVIVFQVQVRAAETYRQPLFDQLRPAATSAPHDPTRPVLQMCSYCQFVLAPSVDPKAEWVSATRYEQAGLPLNVQISHGVCPLCYESVIVPQLQHGRCAP